MLIREVEQELWKVARRIAVSLPPDRLGELQQAVYSLTTYVLELERQKSRIYQAWATLEAQ